MKKLLFLASLLLVACQTTSPRFSTGPGACEGVIEVDVAEAPAWYLDELLHTAQLLTARVPTNAAVVIEVAKQKGYWGTAQWMPEQNIYLIRLDPDIEMPAFLQVVLLHEWAHCMVWNLTHREKPCDPHTEAWGAAFSQAYRAALAGPLTFEEEAKLEWPPIVDVR